MDSSERQNVGGPVPDLGVCMRDLGQFARMVRCFDRRDARIIPSPFAKFRRIMTPCLWQLRRRIRSAEPGAEYSLDRVVVSSRQSATKAFIRRDQSAGSAHRFDSGCKPRGLDPPLEVDRNECDRGAGKQQVGCRLAFLRVSESA